MYDHHIGPGTFYKYRDILADIYEGNDSKYSLEEVEEDIHKEYENGKLSAYQYDNLMSFVQSMTDI